VPLLNATTFAWFTNAFDFGTGNIGNRNGIHGMGHLGIGGEVSASIPVLETIS
jgi:hypothetical protein